MMTNPSASGRFFYVQKRGLLHAMVLGASTLAAAQVAPPAQCIAPYQFIELQAHTTGSETDSYGSTRAVLGMYERISPDGRFILRSFSGRKLGDVALLELPAPSAASPAVVRTYATALKNEAFPVQGSWRYLVNPDGQHYTLAEVLAQQQRAQPLFKGGMTGFYAAAAELPAQPTDAPHTVRIRSLSWPMGDGLFGVGQGSLYTRTITVNTQAQKVVADTGAQALCGERVAQDGSMYALPMISTDGSEFAALPQKPVAGQPTMRVFAFAPTPAPKRMACTLRAAFTGASGKTIFGYASASAAAPLAYEYAGQIWWYHRGLQQGFMLPVPDSVLGQQAPAGGEWIPSAFPGITQDGRVIWGATWQHCGQRPCTQRVGYVIADPYQSPRVRAALAQRAISAPQCITQAQVQAARARFAAPLGLEP